MQASGENGMYKPVGLFNQNGTLSTLQCGGRAKSTTIYHLLSLEATISTAQANGAQVLSIFFDMEKAYES